MKNKKRGVGIRSNILLDDVDIQLLKILKDKKSLSISEMQEKLNMSHMSLKIHDNRLVESKLITKERVPKSPKFILNITDKGKEVLNIFNKSI